MTLTCPAYLIAFMHFGIVLNPPTYKTQACSQQNRELLISVYLGDVVDTSPLGLGQSNDLSQHGIIL